MNTPNTTSSQRAFRRLVVLGAIVLGFIVYAYGWEITDISLEETQEPSRQSSVQRALRELLSPNLFDQQVEADLRLFTPGCEPTTQRPLNTPAAL